MSNKTERLIEIVKTLKVRRTPISIKKLSEDFGVNERTIRRNINELRDEYFAPIRKKEQGIYLDESNEKFELPGIWLTSSELIGMATITKTLHEMGMATNENPSLSELKAKVDDALSQNGISADTFYSIIKLIPSHKQSHRNKLFSRISEAVLKGNRLKISYIDYRGLNTTREISPLKLVNYREHWFLDAYCHLRKGLRQFKLFRIAKAEVLIKRVKEVSKGDQKNHYESSYGIFSGNAKHIAKLRFYGDATREVSQQQWHPEQQGEWQDQDYILSFPFNQDKELIRDVLQFGEGVEVLAPSTLRNGVKQVLKSVLNLYGQ